jgi:uncharacterized protein
VSVTKQRAPKQKAEPLFEGKLKSIRVAKWSVGQCLTATDALRARTAIGRVKGKVIRDGDYSSEYCIDLSNGTVLEPAAPFKFLNHACEPNCELILWKVPQDDDTYTLEIWLHTLRKIKPDEELTIDYAWPASVAIPCLCNSENCRNWIVAAEELPLIKKRRAAEGSSGSKAIKRSKTTSIPR